MPKTEGEKKSRPSGAAMLSGLAEALFPHRMVHGKSRSRVGGFAITSVLAVLCTDPALAAAEPHPIGGPSVRSVHYPIKSRPLGEVLGDIAARSGITFRLADGLSRDRITQTLHGKDWTEAAGILLQDYNYAVELGEEGSWATATITGRKGDGKDAPRKQADRKGGYRSFARQEANGLPPRFRGFKTGSVSPVTLPLVTLKGMKKGGKITLDLPVGRISLVHDNRFNHGNGDITWVGYLENEGQPYRGMITMGKYGPIGHLTTPDGVYQIVTEGGQTYLIDIDASGLQSGSFLEDQVSTHPSADGGHGEMFPANQEIVVPNTGSFSSLASTSNNAIPANNTEPHSGSNDGSWATIDLLVLYTRRLDQPDARIDYLTDVTNQAFLDSGISAKIRVVHRQPVDYTETNENARALSDLSFANHPFQNVQALREKFGADLVTLIRPFHAGVQKGCGVAWVNGSNGSEFSPHWAYSVVSEGADRDGNLIYCGQKALAHELGHNLGNVHDKPLANIPGAFPYSYAWGVEGLFGTIMSYRQPSLLLFASPLLAEACHGQPCGYAEGDPNASDNARTINQTAPIVSGFQPTVVPDKNK